MSVAIAFNGGAYGTYLEWCLTTLTQSKDIVIPFGQNGNSHQFGGNHLENFSAVNKFIDLYGRNDFYRFHPKVTKQESISKNLTAVCENENTQALIHLYPDKNSVLLCINNFFSKIYDDWWPTAHFDEYIDCNKIYNNWPVHQHTTIQNIPVWIRREFLSFYLMPSWFDQVEWYHPDTWQHNKCQVVTVNELLFDFKKTLASIEVFCGLQYIRPISQLLPIHEQKLQQQQHLNEDELCNQIIHSVIEQQEFSWTPRSLASESWIQWQLRNLGYEIECHELDIFPTNSVHLRKLLYKP